ncbi:unnamed protein product [Phytophthora lilii]|uniref:Unnamed protein product n=1 Tax=Phytophthora lilii TaxID=2077276 RepID=A0A9W6WNP9_9STRA|nr:unnamed protein product [Phytophthora lilii]
MESKSWTAFGKEGRRRSLRSFSNATSRAQVSIIAKLDTNTPMRSFWTIFIALALIVATSHGVVADTRFCTQDEKQLANKLHEQNADPAKSCYRAANGDITTLDTSRLCPLPECTAWLAYMAANAPDCYFDSTNHALEYAAKNADCTGGSSTSASVSGSASTSQGSSSSGSEGSGSLANATAADGNSSSSFSAMREDRDLNTSSSLSNSLDSSMVGSVSSVGGSGSMDSSSDASAGVTTAPTPTPTEDLTIEDAPASGTSDSSSSSTPAPTTSASAPLPTRMALLCMVVATAVVFDM